MSILWVLVLMAALLSLLFVFSRVEHAAVTPKEGGSTLVVVLGPIATAAGLVGLVAQGFLPGSGPGGIAAIPLPLLGAGAMLPLPRASRRA